MTRSIAVKPLGQLFKLTPRARTPKPPKPSETPAHSKRNSEHTQRYHARVVAGNRASDRGTARLNPNPSVAKANTQGRTFPGLAN